MFKVTQIAIAGAGIGGAGATSFGLSCVHL